MLAIPKLTHLSHKRQNTLDSLLKPDMLKCQNLQSNLTFNQKRQQLPKTQALLQCLKNKQNNPITKKPFYVQQQMVNYLQHRPYALNLQKNLSIYGRHQKSSPLREKSITFNQSSRHECFSPKYIKERQENARILQSLRLQNQKCKKLFSDINLSTKRQTTTHKYNHVKQFTLDQFDNLEQTSYTVKKIGRFQKKALDEMTDLTSSFIFDQDFKLPQSTNFKVSQVNQPIASVKQTAQDEMSVSEFEVIKFLGKGNFGQVNLVRHRLTNFICAMKTIKKSFIKQQKITHQISRQIRIHQSLKHLNIISFYGFFSDLSHIYLLTQYATSGQLFTLLKSSYRLAQPLVPRILKQTLQGLNLIHSLGYIHRDIKPQNILFQFGVAKICDFGWAVQCGVGEMRSSYCGTPLYLAPEMVTKQLYDKATDVWALGILAYQLLVGKIPFNIWCENDLQQIVDRQVKFPTSYVDMSEQSMDFISKCLVKNPQRRVKISQLINHQFLASQFTKEYFNVNVYDTVQLLFQ